MICVESLYKYVRRNRRAICEVSRQVPSRSRSINNKKGGGNYISGGGPTTSKTSDIILTFELRGRGDHIGKTASDLHVVSKLYNNSEELRAVGKLARTVI
jgi:hypothetical protein